MTYNLGYVQIGTSHDTSEFACDSIRYWWFYLRMCIVSFGDLDFVAV